MGGPDPRRRARLHAAGARHRPARRHGRAGPDPDPTPTPGPDPGGVHRGGGAGGRARPGRTRSAVAGERAALVRRLRGGGAASPATVRAVLAALPPSVSAASMSTVDDAGRLSIPEADLPVPTAVDPAALSHAGPPPATPDRAGTPPGTPAATVPLDARPPAAPYGRAPRPVAAGGVPASTVGGLVLLYPWLGGYCAAAERLVPEAGPVPARRAALALLAGADPADPLVRLLAGDPDWAGTGAPALADPEPAVAEALEPAAVLAAFAGLLPGFAASTPGYVREQWVRRPAALLRDGGDTVLLRLGRRPLDLVLDHLPYPLGAVRLPWTPRIGVGWEAP
ncbi:contractile injection system tape measure protein [Phytohabitans suffuscus]|uniref:contractile injection system tape measure protein n=1 Tax=Phytohabitans suffuscus TaxID=624315 RepID=UPI0015657977|nr:contractile injection system tape measure protein [Phytohabitans suffuscus]